MAPLDRYEPSWENEWINFPEDWVPELQAQFPVASNVEWDDCMGRGNNTVSGAGEGSDWRGDDVLQGDDLCEMLNIGDGRFPFPTNIGASNSQLSVTFPLLQSDFRFPVSQQDLIRPQFLPFPETVEDQSQQAGPPGNLHLVSPHISNYLLNVGNSSTLEDILISPFPLEEEQETLEQIVYDQPQLSTNAFPRFQPLTDDLRPLLSFPNADHQPTHFALNNTIILPQTYSLPKTAHLPNPHPRFEYDQPKKTSPPMSSI